MTTTDYMKTHSPYQEAFTTITSRYTAVKSDQKGLLYNKYEKNYPGYDANCHDHVHLSQLLNWATGTASSKKPYTQEECARLIEDTVEIHAVLDEPSHAEDPIATVLVGFSGSKAKTFLDNRLISTEEKMPILGVDHILSKMTRTYTRSVNAGMNETKAKAKWVDGSNAILYSWLVLRPNMTPHIYVHDKSHNHAQHLLHYLDFDVSTDYYVLVPEEKDSTPKDKYEKETALLRTSCKLADRISIYVDTRDDEIEWPLHIATHRYNSKSYSIRILGEIDLVPNSVYEALRHPIEPEFRSLNICSIS